MSFTLEVLPPFKIFYDKGAEPDPLENGYIYIGEAGLDPETNPITVYWDAARTIAAAQPIRTIGGRPDRDGSAAKIYTDEDYSITVKNSKQELVETSLRNYTDELNKFYYFDTVDELKAADTASLLGERIAVYVGNGTGSTGGQLDWKGGMFIKTDQTWIPSAERYNANGEYEITDINSVIFKSIAKAPVGSFVGRHLLSDVTVDNNLCVGHKSPSNQTEDVIGRASIPRIKLDTNFDSYQLETYYFDPPGTVPTRRFTFGTEYSSSTYKYVFDSLTTGASNTSLPIFIRKGGGQSIEINNDYVRKSASSSTFYYCENTNLSSVPDYGFKINYGGLNSGGLLAIGDNSDPNDSKDLILYELYNGSIYHYIKMTRDSGPRHDNEDSISLESPVSPSVYFADPVHFSGNRFKAAVADCVIYDNATGATCNFLDYGFIGQHVTFVVNTGAGNLTFNNTGNIRLAASPTTITASSTAITFVCYDVGDATGLTNKWALIA